MNRCTVVKTTDLSNGTPIVNSSEWPEDQVRIVFDGDGVLFSDEAERVFKIHGLEAFRKSEQEKEHIALQEGPMHAFAFKLQRLRELLGEDNKWRVRTFLVTARDSTTNERAFKTLKKWGLEIDETHFLGGLDKTPFLIVIDPAIFFDDSSEHIHRAQKHVPAAHIVYGILNVKKTDGEVAQTIKVVVPGEELKETKS
jgi:5'-nucleotidase